MLELSQLSKKFGKEITALDEVSLTIEPGEFVAVLGRSGAGKSTLVRCINGLVKPDAGEISFDSSKVVGAKNRDMCQVRRQMGMIFQRFNLVERLDVLTNVLTGRLGWRHSLGSLFGFFPKVDIQMAEEAIEKVGLTQFKHQLVKNLSGGQQQRVAIARALVQQPKLILGDEPVASLDPATASSIMELLKKFNQEENITIILNMHSLELSQKYARRVIGLNEGKVVFDGSPDKLDSQAIAKIYGADINKHQAKLHEEVALEGRSVHAYS